MDEKSSVDDLTIGELEELLEAKRRAQGLERFRRVTAEEKGKSMATPRSRSTRRQGKR